MPSMTSPQKHPKTGVYYFRRVVPSDIRETLGRGREIKRSLKTKDRQEANRLIVSHIAETDDLFSLARLRLNDSEDVKLTAKDAAVIASRWYERLKVEIDEKGGEVGLVAKSVDDEGRLNFDNISFNLKTEGSDIYRATESELSRLGEQLSEFIDDQLKLESIYVPKGSESYRRLAVEFHNYLFELEKLCRARLVNDWSYKASPSIANESLSVDSKPQSENEKVTKGTPISEIYKAYRESEDVKSRGDLSRAKSLDEYAAQVKSFIEIIGDLPIETIKSAELSKFRDTLLQMPKSKAEKVRAMSVADQIAYAKAHNEKLKSPNTVKNALKKISGIFTYAVEIELIDVNPVARVKKPIAKKVVEATELERGYSKQDLEAIFKHPIFTDKGAHKTYGWASYWVPLICRYTGARLNEIGQLNREDIEQSDGIYYFNIRRGEGQSVKANASIRHVPIHSHLIELGFLEYCDTIKQGRLFPQVPLDKYGKASNALSSWWGDRVRETKVDPKAPSHEFRHTIKTEFRELGVPDSVSDRITGHTVKNEGARYGSVSLEYRKEVIDKLLPLSIKQVFLS